MFSALRKWARKFCEDDSLRVAVVGDTATQLLTLALRGALAERGVGARLFEAEYNQVARQLLAADSEVRRFGADVAVVWEAGEHWYVSGESAEKRLARVRMYAEAFPGTLLYVNVGALSDGVFGNYTVEASWPVQVRKFNAGLDALAMEVKNLHVVDLADAVARLGEGAFDPVQRVNADMPLGLDAQAMLARRVADVVCALRGKVRKCVIVDLDNTLWGGVLGEDGLEGIAIGECGCGKAHEEVQRWLLRLRQRGVLLAVCSKNDEALAKEPFTARREMVLRLEDFACFVANWQTKADNVAHIQKVLNIGFDSMVFLDDNPVERAMVRQAYPAVCVPELPEDPAQWVAYLAGLNLFETVSFSEEDATRTEQYRVEAKRVEWEASFTSEAEFLANLGMTAQVRAFDEHTIPRAAQLTQRSNQFNLRTRRYTEDDLWAFKKDPTVLPLCFTLKDRFGDNGLVSVLIGQRQGTTLFLDTWLMSCRVLKRGLEVFALNALVARAKSLGVKTLVGEYLPTKKNAMVAHLYEELGFSPAGDGRYTLDCASYEPRKVYINED